MACCKCCCGNKNCDEGEIGKCCCGGPTGTCCKEDEYCCDGECEPAPCSGACCDPVFGCGQAADEETCTEGGGTWLGPGISCDPNPCPGACCDEVFGGCTQESQADCEESGRTFLGVGVACGPNTCECTRPEDCEEGEACCCGECTETYLPQPDFNNSAPCRACSVCKGEGSAGGPYGTFIAMMDAYAALGVSTPLSESLCDDGFYFETCEFEFDPDNPNNC